MDRDPAPGRTSSDNSALPFTKTNVLHIGFASRAVSFPFWRRDVCIECGCSQLLSHAPVESFTVTMVADPVLCFLREGPGTLKNLKWGLGMTSVVTEDPSLTARTRARRLRPAGAAASGSLDFPHACASVRTQNCF